MPEKNKTEMHVLLTTEHYARELKDRVKGRKVLELGVGTGVLTQLILDAGAHEVVGYEILPDVCRTSADRFTLHTADYTSALNFKDQTSLTRVFQDFCLVANPAYSTLPFIIEKILPYMRDAILMIPERMLVKFRQLGFHELFLLEGSEFEPRAEGVHLVVMRGFEEGESRFIDLNYEVSFLKSETVSERIVELGQRLPGVALCGLGGFPFVREHGGLMWCGLYVTPEMLQVHVQQALGLSAVLTYANKKNHSLDALGKICVERKETWAYHWVTATFAFAHQAPAVHLAFAHDTRFKMGWAVQKEGPGTLFDVWTASASLKDWIRFTSKKDDPSFDAATRAAMAKAYDLLQGILP